MPLFEFECVKCGKPFEKLVRGGNVVVSIACPACGSHKTKKRISSFAHSVKGGSSTPKSGKSCGCAGNCGGCKGCGQ